MTILVNYIPISIAEDKEYYYILFPDGVDKGLGIRKTSYNGEALTSVMDKLMDIQEWIVHQNQTGSKAKGLHEYFMREQENLVKEGILFKVSE